jgi:hypothetical protein
VHDNFLAELLKAVTTMQEYNDNVLETTRTQYNRKMFTDFVALEKSIFEALETARNHTETKKNSTLLEVKAMLDAKRAEIITELQKWTEV